MKGTWAKKCTTLQSLDLLFGFSGKPSKLIMSSKDDAQVHGLLNPTRISYFVANLHVFIWRWEHAHYYAFAWEDPEGFPLFESNSLADR